MATKNPKPAAKSEKPKRVAKAKAEKPKRVRKAKPEPEPDPYSEILAMLDQLLDSAEDDLSREAMDPLAALRAKCATLTVALRMCLLALSCHGQQEDFARQIAENLDTIVKLKEVWNEAESQEDFRAGSDTQENDNDEAGEEASDEADEEAGEDSDEYGDDEEEGNSRRGGYAADFDDEAEVD